MPLCIGVLEIKTDKKNEPDELIIGSVRRIKNIN
jgi:hypothetical protein